jgi:hypothetical protein
MVRALRYAAFVALALTAVFAAAGPARAQIDLLSADAVHGVVDLRIAGADGEPSFTDGGFGKARYGGEPDHGWKGQVQIAEAGLEWTPRLTWSLSAVVDAAYQPGQEHPVDLIQAYALFKPTPRSATRFQARFGYFYPPISLEHDGRLWGLSDTITPSAINTWVGEEVKVVGAEATLAHDFGDDRVAATAGLFGFDDTAGTLLAFRGWAMHDIKSQLNGSFPLPPRSRFFDRAQGDDTYSSLEIDHRLGYYGKLAWTPSAAPLTVEALYYDNRGDRVSVVPPEQWAWNTRFTNLGATAKLGEHTRLMGQALAGRTEYGFPTPLGLWVDVVFRSAYLLGEHELGPNAFTLRGDLFEVKDRTMAFGDNKNEHGWALTAAWRRTLSDHLDLRLEALHIESTRPARAVLADEAPRQAQTVLQSSLRFGF